MHQVNLGYQKAKEICLNIWKKRQKREQIFLMSGFSLVLIWMIYTAILSPLMTYQSRVIDSYENFQSYLPYIAKTMMTYQTLSQEGGLLHAPSRQSLQSQISDMLINEQLVPFGLQTTSPNPSLAVLSFKQAPFDALMNGVESLNKQGVFVIEAHLTEVNKKGIVEGTLTFSQLK